MKKLIQKVAKNSATRVWNGALFTIGAVLMFGIVYATGLQTWAPGRAPQAGPGEGNVAPLVHYDANGNVNINGKITSIATNTNDAATTLTTKGYVDTKILSTSHCGWVSIHNGGLQGANYVYYNDGADHSPTAICLGGGYSYYMGACRFIDTNNNKYQGSVVANTQTYSPNWAISCNYGQDAFYFYANRTDGQILCCK